MTPGSMSIERDGDKITLKADHGGGYAQWYFPEFFIKDTSVFEGADGLVLRRKHSHNTNTKLTAFICMLTVRASIGASVTVSATSSAIADVLTRPTLFSYERGRLVVASRDGKVITEDKLKELVEKTGADRKSVV